MKNKKTHSVTDANGTTFILDDKTRMILTSMDKNGFIYNSKGERIGNIHGHEYIEGYNYE